MKVSTNYQRERKTMDLTCKKKVSIDYSQAFDDINKTLKEHNPTKKIKVLTVINDMITDMEFNKKLSPIVTELFMRDIKLNISLVFKSQCCFKVPKSIRIS